MRASNEASASMGVPLWGARIASFRSGKWDLSGTDLPTGSSNIACETRPTQALTWTASIGRGTGSASSVFRWCGCPLQLLGVCGGFRRSLAPSSQPGRRRMEIVAFSVARFHGGLYNPEDRRVLRLPSCILSDRNRLKFRKLNFETFTPFKKLRSDFTEPAA